MDVINNQLHLIHHLNFGRMILSKETQKGYVKALTRSYLVAYLPLPHYLPTKIQSFLAAVFMSNWGFFDSWADNFIQFSSFCVRLIEEQRVGISILLIWILGSALLISGNAEFEVQVLTCKLPFEICGG